MGSWKSSWTECYDHIFVYSLKLELNYFFKLTQVIFNCRFCRTVLYGIPKIVVCICFRQVGHIRSFQIYLRLSTYSPSFSSHTHRNLTLNPMTKRLSSPKKTKKPVPKSKPGAHRDIATGQISIPLAGASSAEGTYV